MFSTIPHLSCPSTLPHPQGKTPLDIARAKGKQKCVAVLERAAPSGTATAQEPPLPPRTSKPRPPAAAPSSPAPARPTPAKPPQPLPSSSTLTPAPASPPPAAAAEPPARPALDGSNPFAAHAAQVASAQANTGRSAAMRQDADLRKAVADVHGGDTVPYNSATCMSVGRSLSCSSSRARRPGSPESR